VKIAGAALPLIEQGKTLRQISHELARMGQPLLLVIE